MSELAIYYEQDDEGKDTGRVQVCEELNDDEVFVLETFDTEEEAEQYKTATEAEFARNEKIQSEYLEWEKACLERHSIKKGDLREYLINCVLLDTEEEEVTKGE